MVFEAMNVMYNRWNVLQQPPHTNIGITASSRSLLAPVDQGWQVEEPVEVMVEVMPTTRENL